MITIPIVTPVMLGVVGVVHGKGECRPRGFNCPICCGFDDDVKYLRVYEEKCVWN